MNLRLKIEKLVEEAPLPREEKTTLQFVLETNGDGELEGMLFPDVETHVNGRYEWFFLPNGALRRSVR